MTSEAKIIHPSIKEFTGNLAMLLSADDCVEVFRNGTPEQKLEKVIIASDHLLQPNGNFILVNADLPLKELLQLQK